MYHKYHTSSCLGIYSISFAGFTVSWILHTISPVTNLIIKEIGMPLTQANAQHYWHVLAQLHVSWWAEPHIRVGIVTYHLVGGASHTCVQCPGTTLELSQYIGIAIRHSAIYLYFDIPIYCSILHVLCEPELDNWNVNVDKISENLRQLTFLYM